MTPSTVMLAQAGAGGDEAEDLDHLDAEDHLGQAMRLAGARLGRLRPHQAATEESSGVDTLSPSSAPVGTPPWLGRAHLTPN